MKITYLTKCPNCGGSIDEEFSKFCPFCGNSLAKNEPMSREERLKMYEYEDQTVPQKKIVINGKCKNNTKAAGITLLLMGVIIILIGIFLAICAFAMPILATFGGNGAGFNILSGIEMGMVTFAIFGGGGFFFAASGIVLWVNYENDKREYKKIPNDPDEVIEGMVRRFDVQGSGRYCYYYVYIRVEKPKPMILECQYFDLSIGVDFKPEQKVKIYRKEDKYIMTK